MKLSACVITKNEERNLPQWLSCMSQFADEMIVVDTGSTDCTVSLAQQAGARVYHFSWCNDFSAAKNYAIERATGDWILFLDADEYFDKECIIKIRTIMQGYHRQQDIGLIFCRLVNIDTERNNQIIDTILQSRIFRRTPGIRYINPVHETLINTQGMLKMVCNNDLIIWHTGYSHSVRKAKARRDLDLMLARLENTETVESEDELAVNLMDAYYTLENYEKAIYYGRKALAAKIDFLGMAGNCYETIIGSMEHAGYDIDAIYAVLDEAMEAYPEEACFPMEKGYMLWNHQEYEASWQYLQHGLSLRNTFEERSERGEFTTDSSLRLLQYVYLALGDMACRKNDIAVAAEYYMLGLQYQKKSPALLRGLYDAVRENCDDVDIIQLLNSLYTREVDSDFILDTLGEKLGPKIAAYYGAAALRQDKAKLYLYTHHYDVAAIEASHAIKDMNNQLAARNIADQVTKGIAGNKLLGTLLAPAYQKACRSGALNTQDKAIKSVLRILEHYHVGYVAGNCIDLAKNPLVSIMIPTYNRPVLFEKTLQSALRQTYTNIEILVNDNSTDETTFNLIQPYLSDDRIHYYRNTSAKTKAANFKPFQAMAKGEYLQWCMDDDILASDKLALMVPVLRDNPDIALVTSQRGYIDINDQVVKDNDANPLIDAAEKSAWRCYSGKDMGAAMLSGIHNLIGEPSAVLFRRQDLTNHYWEADCRGYAAISDVVMWLELLHKGDVVVFKDPLSYYRRHITQEGQQPDVILNSRLEWLRLLEEQKQLYDTSVIRQGKRKLWQDYMQNKDMPSLQKADNYHKYVNKISGLAGIL